MTNKKRILLVSNGFFPEISPRSYRVTELAKEFYRQGHNVTVISKYRDHDYTDFLHQYPIKLKMWGKSFLKPVPSSIIGYSKNISKRRETMLESNLPILLDEEGTGFRKDLFYIFSFMGYWSRKSV